MYMKNIYRVLERMRWKENIAYSLLHLIQTY